MPIDTCNAHKAPATHRCPICHMPLCQRCDYAGVCSERCHKSREKFGGPVVKVPRSGGFGWIWTVVHWGVLLAIAYAACYWFGLDPIAIVKDLIPK